jgi:hypothetical protein
MISFDVLTITGTGEIVAVTHAGFAWSQRERESPFRNYWVKINGLAKASVSKINDADRTAIKKMIGVDT